MHLKIAALKFSETALSFISNAVEVSYSLGQSARMKKHILPVGKTSNAETYGQLQ